jgi:hypothetical protein
MYREVFVYDFPLYLGEIKFQLRIVRNETLNEPAGRKMVRQPVGKPLLAPIRGGYE